MEGENNTRVFVLPVTVGLSVLLIMVCVIYCLFSALIPQSAVVFASSMLRTKLPEGTIILTNEDNSGFDLPIPGGISDGDIFMILQIPLEEKAEFSNTLKASIAWKDLPLPTEFVENVFNGDRMPLTASTGYYLFIDSQEEYNKTHNKPDYDTTRPFYERYSYNYTFGLFNKKDGKLYLVRFDT